MTGLRPIRGPCMYIVLALGYFIMLAKTGTSTINS